MSKKESLRKKLLMIDMYPTSLIYKLVYFLKDYFDITLVSLSKGERYFEETYKKLGINVYSFNFGGQKYWKDKKIFSGLKEGLKFAPRFIKIIIRKYDYVLAKTGPEWIGYLLFKIFRKAKKIYFPYDIGLFCSCAKNRQKLDKVFERYNFEHADFIIHRGPEDELDLIRKSEIKKIKGKPVHFPPYCFDNWIMPIKKEKDKLNGLCLVYIGTSCTDPLLEIQWPDIFKLIAKQGIDVHVYPTRTSKENIPKKNIHIHKPLPNLELNKIMGRYHYGLVATFFNKKVVDKRLSKTTVGNKIFSYLEAGIPIIVDNETEFPLKLVRKYKCGIVVSKNDLSNLKEILEKQNYSRLLKGVKKAREELRISKHIKRLLIELTEGLN